MKNERQYDIYFIESGKFTYSFQYENYMNKKVYKYYVTEIDGQGFVISEDEINKESFTKLKATAKPVYNFFRAGGGEERKLYQEMK